MADPQELEPPLQTNVADPGAHQLAEASDSEDQFTDAQSIPESPKISSPIPTTRVEKVDDEPSYGEVPGTEAYKLRENDAEPDEIAVSSEKLSGPSSPAARSAQVIPITVIEESPGEYPGEHSPEQQEKHKVDAVPDLILNPHGGVKSISGDISSDAPQSPNSSSISPRRDASKSPKPLESETIDEEFDNGDAHENDDFGDDFDDFEEGAQDEGFNDFEDGFHHAQSDVTATPVPQPILQQPTLPFSIPDFDGSSPDEVISTIEPSLASLFPPEELEFPTFPPLSKDSSIFLTPRSASLWSQLVAPPPLAPPDWIRSRTRRLFLVSLGVPVDLDEILPASKQKKLVLPSLNIPGASPRASTESRSVSRLKQGDGNASSTSLDSQGKPSPSSRRRKGPPTQPELDLVAAKHLCRTTDEALDGMTDEELNEHVAKLKAMEGAAKDVLDYWTKRTDEKIGDREAFEGVIENLVAHARKVRK